MRSGSEKSWRTTRTRRRMKRLPKTKPPTKPRGKPSSRRARFPGVFVPCAEQIVNPIPLAQPLDVGLQLLFVHERAAGFLHSLPGILHELPPALLGGWPCGLLPQDDGDPARVQVRLPV